MAARPGATTVPRESSEDRRRRPLNAGALHCTAMLTIESDDDGTVFIHGDAAGLQGLADRLNRLVAATPEGTFDHAHLMTPSWAGNELSEQRRHPAARLVHHVKLYCWKDDRDTV